MIEGTQISGTHQQAKVGYRNGTLVYLTCNADVGYRVWVGVHMWGMCKMQKLTLVWGGSLGQRKAQLNIFGVE